MLYPVHFVYVSVNLAEIERGCRLMIGAVSLYVQQVEQGLFPEEKHSFN